MTIQSSLSLAMAKKALFLLLTSLSISALHSSSIFKLGSYRPPALLATSGKERIGIPYFWRGAHRHPLGTGRSMQVGVVQAMRKELPTKKTTKQIADKTARDTARAIYNALIQYPVPREMHAYPIMHQTAQHVPAPRSASLPYAKA